MTSYLSLSIPVFLNSFNNHFVPLFPVLQYSFLEDFFQVRSIHITVALGCSQSSVRQAAEGSNPAVAW
jgi:hypothetical protein